MFVFDKFINACRQPSDESLLESFGEIRAFASGFSSSNEVAVFLLKNIDESMDDYREAKKVENDSVFRKFIPVPDDNKKNNSIWVLPNLSSFTNVYARINKFHQGRVSEIKIFHDEQPHFDEIIQTNKKLMEEVDMSDFAHVQSSQYDFYETASLMFAKSHEHIPIQVADLLAGMVMRYLQEKLEGVRSRPEIIKAYDLILRNSNPNRGPGVNLVTTSKIHFDLHFMSAMP